MEVAGLVIGGVSVAGLFTVCVECFEYVQVGRELGKNYQTALLKLDLLKLRLSRWFTAVRDSAIIAQSEEEIKKAHDILGQIIYLFDETEKRSKKFDKGSRGSGEIGTGPTTDMDADLDAIHQKMRNLALKRQKQSTFTQKAKWALYEEKQFKRLIEDIDPLVRDLVELFPATKAQERQLSLEEAQELQAGPERGVEMLQEANEGEDELLRESMNELMAGQFKHQYQGNSVKGEALARYGDEFEGGPVSTGAGSMYRDNKAEGKVKVHYGDHHGQGSIFSS